MERERVLRHEFVCSDLPVHSVYGCTAVVCERHPGAASMPRIDWRQRNSELAKQGIRRPRTKQIARASIEREVERRKLLEEDLKDAMKNPSDYLGYCELMDWEAAHRHIKSEKKRHKLLQEKARRKLEHAHYYH